MDQSVLASSLGKPLISEYTALIRAKNSEGTIGEAIARLIQQSHPPKEIMVVDSGSTDSTLQIAAENDCRIVHYPKGEPFNYSRALNIGFASSITPFVLVISSHVWLNAADTTRWMHYLLTHLPVAGVYCLFGSVREPMLETVAPRFVTVDGDNFNGLNGLSNCCAIYRRSDWEQRPFDETVPTAEDQLWAKQAYAEGRATLCLLSHVVGYLNPRAGVAKTVREVSYVSLYILPQDGQGKRWRQHLITTVKRFFRGRWQDSLIHLIVARNCFLHTVLGIRYTGRHS